jgi:hypothetical protein
VSGLCICGDAAYPAHRRPPSSPARSPPRLKHAYSPNSSFKHEAGVWGCLASARCGGQRSLGRLFGADGLRWRAGHEPILLNGGAARVRAPLPRESARRGPGGPSRSRWAPGGVRGIRGGWRGAAELPLPHNQRPQGQAVRTTSACCSARCRAECLCGPRANNAHAALTHRGAAPARGPPLGLLLLRAAVRHARLRRPLLHRRALALVCRPSAPLGCRRTAARRPNRRARPRRTPHAAVVPVGPRARLGANGRPGRLVAGPAAHHSAGRGPELLGGPQRLLAAAERRG